MFTRNHRCFFRLSLCLLILFSALFLSSCKSSYIAPTKTFVHTTDKSLSDADNISVVIDTCIKMDELKDFISVPNSRSIESYMASAIKSYLENIGYNISDQETPFVGSFKVSSKPFTVQLEKKGKKIKTSPPFFTDEKLAEDNEYQETMQRVMQTLFAVFQQKDVNPLEQFEKNESLQNDLQILKEKLKTRYILIVVGDGTNVPGLTSFSQYMVTGVGTAVLTGGLLSVAVCDVTYIDTYATVIDLEQNSMLWSNSLRLKEGKIFKEKYYSTWNAKSQTYDGWVQQIFFYIPVKTTKFIEAVKKNKKDTVNWMILTDVDLDRGDESQMTALHWSVKDNYLETVKLLLKHKANINCQDVEGNTPLHYAVSNNRYSIAQYLLKKKADVHIKNSQGENPLDIATSKKYKKLMKLLKKYDKK